MKWFIAQKFENGRPTAIGDLFAVKEEPCSIGDVVESDDEVEVERGIEWHVAHVLGHELCERLQVLETYENTFGGEVMAVIVEVIASEAFTAGFQKGSEQSIDTVTSERS